MTRRPTCRDRRALPFRADSPVRPARCCSWLSACRSGWPTWWRCRSPRSPVRRRYGGCFELERALVNRLLGARVPAPPPLTPPDDPSTAHRSRFSPESSDQRGCAASSVPSRLLVFVRAGGALDPRAGGEHELYLGPWSLGAILGLVLLLLARAGADAVGRRLGGDGGIDFARSAAVASAGPASAAGTGAGGARRAAGRSNARDRLLASGAPAVRRRAGPSGHASRAGLVQGMDGRGAPRQPRSGDHPRCRAPGPARAGGGGGGRSRAGARQRAAQGRPQRPAAGPARLPATDRRGDGRGPPPARARPARWCPAAPGLDVSLDLQLMRGRLADESALELLDGPLPRSRGADRTARVRARDPPADARRPRAWLRRSMRWRSDPRSRWSSICG